MNCPRHPDMAAAAYCRTCGRALCEACKRDVRGVIYCEDCLATRVQAPMGHPGARPGGGPHPAVAGVLAGFLPFGVGQAYNGQYSRGLVYLVTFIGLIWAASNGPAGGAGPVFGLLIAAFYFWQLIDAIRSASYLQAGLPAPDPFGIDRLFGGAVPQGAPGVPSAPAAPPPPDSLVPPGHSPYTAPQDAASYSGFHPRPPYSHFHSRTPVGALVLIGLGVMLLLGNIGFLRFYRVAEFWPAILIVIGGWLLADRWPRISTGDVRGRHLLLGPAILLVLGFTFMGESLGWIGFGRSWPLILIVIGAVLLWQRTAPPLPPPLSPPPPTIPEQPPGTGLEQEQERQVEHE